jgi:hypothetical protein
MYTRRLPRWQRRRFHLLQKRRLQKLPICPRYSRVRMNLRFSRKLCAKSKCSLVKSFAEYVCEISVQYPQKSSIFANIFPFFIFAKINTITLAGNFRFRENKEESFRSNYLTLNPRVPGELNEESLPCVQKGKRRSVTLTSGRLTVASSTSEVAARSGSRLPVSGSPERSVLEEMELWEEPRVDPDLTGPF